MLSDITNYLEINPMLGTAGQPQADEFTYIRAAGYQVVINLVPPGNPDWLENEDALVSTLGMDYINIPVVWSQPTRANLDAFFSAMDANQGRKVFAHCMMNMRVSAFVLLYRVLRQGVSPDEAWQPLHEIWDPSEYEVWQRFIEEQLAS